VTARTLAATVLVALIGTALAQPTTPANAPVPQPVRAEPKVEKDLFKQLAARVTVQKFDGTFKEAVKMLADAYDLTIVVDPRLGAEDAQGAACDAPADDRPVKLPKLTNVRLDTVLGLVVAQVKGKFLVYPDHIKIVPEAFAAYETGLLPAHSDPNDDPILPQMDVLRNKPLIKRALVNASFKNKPFSEVIDEIVEATGANLAVSPLLPASVRVLPITARFANTPVDAAVRTLCEMIEAGTIEEGTVLLVTTRERAAARAKEDAQKAKDRHATAQPLLGWGAGFPALAPQPDLAAEVAKLKDQNEQLKKQLDLLEKLLRKLTDK
jgi:hypothetical protein